jgi:nucleoid DNA-binding protein
MRKRELVELAARRSSLTRRQMNEAVDAVFAAIAEALTGGEPVILRGFGRFSTWRRRQRIRDFEGRPTRWTGCRSASMPRLPCAGD